MEEITSNPYKKEDKKTLGEVIISQIDVCRKEFSKEMKKGFQTQKVLDGQIITLQIPDQRETVKQCTKTLYDLLLFYFDEKVKENINRIEKNLKSLPKGFLQLYLEQETIKPLKEQAEKTKVIPNTSFGEKMKQQLINSQSECYREMFQELVLLFKRRNELSGKRTLGYK